MLGLLLGPGVELTLTKIETRLLYRPGHGGDGERTEKNK